MKFNIGWFIIGYMVTGVIVSYLSTFIVMAIGFIKDYKRFKKRVGKEGVKTGVPMGNNDMRCVDAINDTFSEAADAAEVIFDPGEPKRAIIKAWIIVNCILWPYSVPLGAVKLLEKYKDYE